MFMYILIVGRINNEINMLYKRKAKLLLIFELLAATKRVIIKIIL